MTLSRFLVSDLQPFLFQCLKVVPITAKNPYLGECKAIPNKSHLILVPGTILGQWQLEVKTALNPKAFDLFVYTTGQAFRNEFWSDEGPFAKSRQQPVNKVILASHSVCHRHLHSVKMLTIFLGPFTGLSSPFQGVKVKGAAMAASKARRGLRFNFREDPLWA